MSNYLLKGSVIALIILLTGCGGANRVGDLFSPSNTPFSSRMTIAQTVQNALLQNGDPVIAQVRVNEIPNGVVLTGYVKKIRQSDTAEQIARQAGVQNVENRIIVRQ